MSSLRNHKNNTTVEIIAVILIIAVISLVITYQQFQTSKEVKEIVEGNPTNWNVNVDEVTAKPFLIYNFLSNTSKSVSVVEKAIEGKVIEISILDKTVTLESGKSYQIDTVKNIQLGEPITIYKNTTTNTCQIIGVIDYNDIRNPYYLKTPILLSLVEKSYGYEKIIDDIFNGTGKQTSQTFPTYWLLDRVEERNECGQITNYIINLDNRE